MRRVERPLVLRRTAALRGVEELQRVDSASSVSEPAAVRSAVDAGWRRQSVGGCFGDSIAVITAAHYGCLRPAIAEARTLVCEFPVLAGKRPPVGGRVRTAMLEKKQARHKCNLDLLFSTTPPSKNPKGAQGQRALPRSFLAIPFW